MSKFIKWLLTVSPRNLKKVWFTWHYIFWISLPFLIIGLLIGLKYLENVTEVTKPWIDLLSIALSTIGFGGVVFGFSKAGEGSEGWGSAIVITSIIMLGMRLLRK